MICLYRTQDLEGQHDPFCIDCWESYEEVVEFPNGNFPCKRSEWYTDREECMQENTIADEEPKVVGKATMTFMIDGKIVVRKFSVVNATKRVVATKIEDKEDYRPIYINTTTLEEIKEEN